MGYLPGTVGRVKEVTSAILLVGYRPGTAGRVKEVTSARTYSWWGTHFSIVSRLSEQPIKKSKCILWEDENKKLFLSEAMSTVREGQPTSHRC